MQRTLLTIAAAGLFPASVHAGLTSITIANPSFQADIFNGGVGYANQNGGAVTGWTISNTGSQGITGTDQGGGAHFIDGVQVDSTRAGFSQGGSEAVPMVWSQNISGLNAGQRYVAQIWARGRNCCGDTPAFDLTYGSQVVVDNFATGNGTWNGVSAAFTAGSASGTLGISSWVLGGGDGTLAIDNIQVFQLDSNYVNILNPSFEAGVNFAFPGYQGGVAGWTQTGPGGSGYNHAINGNSPFADNGAYPEGNSVAFIQNSGSLSQLLSGLTPGQQYLLELDYNSRQGTGSGQISVDLGGTNLLSTGVNPVGGSNSWYHLSAPWTAGGATATLSINGIQVGADSAIAFDRVTLRAIPEPSVSAVALAGLAGLLLRRRRA